MLNTMYRGNASCTTGWLRGPIVSSFNALLTVREWSRPSHSRQILDLVAHIQWLITPSSQATMERPNQTPKWPVHAIHCSNVVQYPANPISPFFVMSQHWSATVDDHINLCAHPVPGVLGLVAPNKLLHESYKLVREPENYVKRIRGA